MSNVIVNQPEQAVAQFKEQWQIDDSSSDIAEVYRTFLDQISGQKFGVDSEAALRKFAEQPLESADRPRFCLPSSFEMDENTFWLRQYGQVSWPQLEWLLCPEAATSAMLLAPFKWQLAGPFYEMCLTNQAVATIFNENNLSSAVLVLKHYPTDVLVTTSAGLRAMVETELSPALIPKKILVVERWGVAPTLITPVGTEVYYDIHVSPGFSVGKKTKAHQMGDSFTFSPADEYLYETVDEQVHITSLVPDLIPFARFPLPGPVTFDNESVTFRYT